MINRMSGVFMYESNFVFGSLFFFFLPSPQQHKELRLPGHQAQQQLLQQQQQPRPKQEVVMLHSVDAHK